MNENLVKTFISLLAKEIAEEIKTHLTPSAEVTKTVTTNTEEVTQGGDDEKQAKQNSVEEKSSEEKPAKKTTPRKTTTRGRPPKKDSALEAFLDRVAEYQEQLGKDAILSVLGDFEVANPKKVKPEDFDEVLACLEDDLRAKLHPKTETETETETEVEAETETDTKADDDSVDMVEVLSVLKEAEEVDKQTVKEIMEDYGVSNEDEIEKLTQAKLEDFYDELLEILED